MAEIHVFVYIFVQTSNYHKGLVSRLPFTRLVNIVT